MSSPPSPPASGGQLFTNADQLIRATGTKSDSTSLNRQYHLDNLGTA